MNRSFHLEPKNDSMISHRCYRSYLPFPIQEIMNNFHIMGLYYHVDPMKLSNFLSYRLNKRLSDHSISYLKEIKTPPSPYRDFPSHLYSVIVSTFDDLVFTISIIKHEIFGNTIIIISVNNAIKMAKIRNEIRNLISDFILSFQARGGEKNGS